MSTAEEFADKYAKAMVELVEEQAVVETSQSLRGLGRYGLMPTDEHTMASPLRINEKWRCRLGETTAAGLQEAITDREVELTGLRKLAALLAASGVSHVGELESIETPDGRGGAVTEMPQRWADGNAPTKTNRLAALALIRACTSDEIDDAAIKALMPQNPVDALEIIVCLADKAAEYMADFAEAKRVTVTELLDILVEVISESDSPD